MALRPVATSWQQEIADVAEEFMNGVIDIYLPSKAGTYDPVTDEEVGGTPDVPLITARKARIQHLNAIKSLTSSGEFTAKQNYLFQIIPEPGDPIIVKGAALSVRDGGKRPQLTKYVFQVVGAPTSSHDPLITIRATTDLAEVR